MSEKYMLIKKETVNNTLKKQCELSHMVLILEMVCAVNDVVPYLPAKLVCKVLNIPVSRLEEAVDKRQIRSEQYGQITVYSAFEIARLGELIQRRKRHRALDRIPTYSQTPQV